MKRIAWLFLLLCAALWIFSCTPDKTLQGGTDSSQVQPNPPVNPDGPDNPDDPGDSGDPTNPGDPTDPSGPGNPEIPAQYAVTFSNPEVTGLTHSEVTLSMTMKGPMQDGTTQAFLNPMYPLTFIAVGKDALEKVETAIQFVDESTSGGIHFETYRLTAHCTGLEAATKYYWRVETSVEYVEMDPRTFDFIKDINAVFQSARMEFTTQPLPVSFSLYTDGMDADTRFFDSVLLKGHAVAQYNPDWSDLAMEWSKDSSFPTAATFRAVPADVTDDLHFTVSATGLEAGTKYYCRACAKVDGQPVYSQAQEFTTLSVDEVFQVDLEPAANTMYVEIRCSLSTLPQHLALYGYGLYYGLPSEGLVHSVGKDEFHWKQTGITWPKAATISDLQPATTYQMQPFLIYMDKTDNTTLYTFRGEVFEQSTQSQPVTGIQLDVHEETLSRQHETRKLTATVAPADASNKKVIWRSSHPNIATVDENGNVNFVGLGPATVTITARTEDGGFEDACVYTLGQAVTEIRPQSAVYELNRGDADGVAVRITISPDNAAHRGGIQTSFTCEPSSLVKNIEKNSDTHFMVYMNDLGGHATVTFTAGDGSGTTGSCEIYVKGPVDMGLSKRWMNCDVKVMRPWSAAGLCVAWGETTSKEQYTLDNHLWYSAGQYTKYNVASDSTDNFYTLESSDDAAKTDVSIASYVQKLRMPTKEEWEELLAGCTWTKTTLNGTEGYLATSKANGNTLFFPHQTYWTSSRVNFISTTGGGRVIVTDRAFAADLENAASGAGYCLRWEGHYVRAVVD